VSTRQPDLLRRVLESHADEIHTCLPGRVRSYDYTTQTASIDLGARRVVRGLDDDEDDDTSEPYPTLVAVPIVWPGTLFGTLHFPLGEGDSVAVFFPEVSIDRWLATGEAEDPGIATRHGIDGAFAIPGLRFRGNRAQASPDNAILLGRPTGTRIEIRDAEIRAGGTKSLAEADDVKAHLSAISAALATIATAAGVTSSYVYATALAASPIATSITKGD
jgi:hypothetical protein